MSLRVAATAATFWLCMPAVALDLPDLPNTGSQFAELDRSVYKCDARNEGLLMCRRAGEKTDRVAGNQVREIMVFYRGGLQVRSVVKVDEQRFSAIAEALTESLGNSEEDIELLNAGMGGAFENRYQIWRHDGRIWMLEQFFERIVYSGLWIMEDAELDTMLAERERRRVRGVRNL